MGRGVAGRAVGRRLAALLVVAAALAPAACGGDAGAGRPRLVVSAAASLKPAFEPYAARFASADVRLSFAGSDELAAQIRQGAAPDVYAAADTRLPAVLHAEGLVDAPVTFAANRLVVAVPAGSAKVRSLADLGRPGVTIAAGAPSVPVGAYTRTLLRRLGGEERRRILANVRSNEPDVAGVVGKLVHGAVDAGFVYVTDVRAARGRLDAIELPARLRPDVAYAAAVVRAAPRPRVARAFLQGLRSGAGRAALRAAGFAPR